MELPDEPPADSSRGRGARGARPRVSASSLRSSLLLLRAELAVDGLARQLEDFRASLQLETRVGTSFYDVAQQGYGRSQWLTGHPRQAEKVLRKLLGDTEDVHTRAGVNAELALIAQDDGRWDAARALQADAERLFPDLGLDETPGFCSFLPLQLAHLRQLVHEDDPGAQEVTAVVGAYAGRMVHRAPWMRLWAAVMLGEVALDEGDHDAARGWSAQAAATLAAYPDAGIFAARSRRLQRALEESSLAVALTRAERRVLDLLPTHLTPPQIGAELFISHNTVKTHLRAIYRKLGASSRAEAVARSRELGLLKS